jgi:hypothetical protein
MMEWIVIVHRVGEGKDRTTNKQRKTSAKTSPAQRRLLLNAIVQSYSHMIATFAARGWPRHSGWSRSSTTSTGRFKRTGPHLPLTALALWASVNLYQRRNSCLNTTAGYRYFKIASRDGKSRYKLYRMLPLTKVFTLALILVILVSVPRDSAIEAFAGTRR